jgi:hypothetical protein
MVNNQLASEFRGDGTGYRSDPAEINGVAVHGFYIREAVTISSIEITEISGPGHPFKEKR